MTVTVYFMDQNRFNAGTSPYEVAVSRVVAKSPAIATAVLKEYFKGPTPQEQAQGLVRLSNGVTGFSSISISNKVAHVRLKGSCNSEGASYTIANLLYVNLTQFSTVSWVKIYDASGSTQQPTGQSNSIPACLEP